MRVPKHIGIIPDGNRRWLIIREWKSSVDIILA